jgi:hypothetical protein
MASAKVMAALLFDAPEKEATCTYSISGGKAGRLDDAAVQFSGVDGN